MAPVKLPPPEDAACWRRSVGRIHAHRRKGWGRDIEGPAPECSSPGGTSDPCCPPDPPVRCLDCFFHHTLKYVETQIIGGNSKLLCFGVFFGLGCSKCLPIGGWNYFIFWLVYLSLCKTMWLSYINIMIPLSLYLNTWENNLFFFSFMRLTTNIPHLARPINSLPLFQTLILLEILEH